MEKVVYCARCEAESNCRQDTRQQTYKVRGEEFLLELPVWVCECGESTVDAAFGDPIEAVYKEYRKKHGR